LERKVSNEATSEKLAKRGGSKDRRAKTQQYSKEGVFAGNVTKKKTAEGDTQEKAAGKL